MKITNFKKNWSLIKKIKLSLFLSTAIFVNAQTPIAYYPFDGNANDAIGTNHGTVNGATLTANRFGNANSAYSLDGVDDFINLPSGSLTNYTLIAWVKFTGNPDNKNIMVYTDASGPGNAWSSQMRTSNTTFQQYCYPLNPGTLDGSTAISTNVWYHVAISASANGQMKIYLNGQPDAMSLSVTGAPWNGGDRFNLGNATGDFKGFFQGDLDDIKIFNNQLTDEQVLADYSGITLPPPSPIAYYPFNSNANDAIGSNDGNVNGATLTTDRFGNTNSAYSFDGVNDYIFYNQPWTANTDNWTMSVWVKSNDLSNCILTNGLNTFPSPDPSLYNGYSLLLQGPRPNGNLNGIAAFDGGADLLTAGIWMHIVFVRENGVAKLYVNGLQQPNTITNNPNVPSGSAIIGALNTDLSFFNGVIDDVKIYDIALTSTQVADQFNSVTGQNFRSIASGDWNSPLTWERYNGDSYAQATVAPSSNDGIIVIRNGHNVTVNSDVIIDQVVIDAGGVITQEAAISMEDGIGYDITVNGTYNWSNGFLNGPGSVMIGSGGILNITPIVSNVLEAEIVNEGTLNLSTGQLLLNSQATIINNGTLNITGSASTSSTENGGFLSNTGTINIDILGIQNFAAINTLANSGIINFNSGTFVYSDGDFANTGSLVFNTGSLQNEGTLNHDNDAIISGTGIISSNGLFVNNGIISPGTSAGIITFNGAQPLSGNSILYIEVMDGSGPGFGHDQLTRNSDLILAGTLTVTETGNVPEGTYTIIHLTSGNVSGNFSTINLPEFYTLQINGSDLQLIKMYPRLDLTLFLEGPFNGVAMNAELNASGLLPLSQPYNMTPWNYSGTETVVSIPNANVVDWVLVEFRDAPDATSATEGTTIAGGAYFLLKDGTVVGLDGSSLPTFDISVSNQLFVLIWHRNHLPVMSKYPLTESGGIYSYDFTTAAGQAYGDNQSDLGGGFFGMIGGNANGDGIVNESDGTEYWYPFAGKPGYHQGDANLDGQVDNKDKNDIWWRNNGKLEILPE